MENHSKSVKQIRRMVSGSLRNAGIARGVLVLAAISGGRDSVVLFDALCALQGKLGFRLCAAHVNHGIRQSAARDEVFVREMCAAHQVPFYCAQVDVPKAKQLSGESLEEAARRLRYETLRKIADDLQADCIVTAHHAADQTETVLLGLLRGSFGLLRGMGEDVHDARGRVLRPMLQVSHRAICEYAAARALAYCTDETNEDPAYLRNRIRLQLVPKLQSDFSASLDQNVQTLAKALQRDEDFLQQLANDLYERHVHVANDGLFLDDALGDVHAALRIRVIEHALQSIRCTTAVKTRESLCELFSMQTGKQIDLGHDLLAQKCAGGVRICQKQIVRDDVVFLQKTGETITPWGVFRVTGPMSCTNPVTDSHSQWIGEDVMDHLYVCLPKSGQRMHPMGLGASKLLSDVMCDAGLDTFARSRTPVVCDAAGPLWVVGCRADERLRLKADQKAYLLEFYAILKE